MGQYGDEPSNEPQHENEDNRRHSSKDGKKTVYCKACKRDVSYVGWGQHCNQHHSGNEKPMAKNADDDADQPGQRAAGVGDAVSIQKKRAPRKATAANYVSKAPKAKAAGRRRT